MKHFQSLLIPLLCLSPAYADYGDDANTAIKSLQDKFYDTNTGLWDNRWWQSGNIVETIAKFGKQDSSFQPTAISIISNTYEKSRNQQGYKDWKNDYYDDMGWWAMGWIASYDLTNDAKYLNTARDLFEDMTGGWNTPCGGLWWNKQHESIASISNELFLAVAASLANRVSANEKEHYMHWAQMEWDWFWLSGVINGDGLINDGIDKSSCKNDFKTTTFTYNQGVVLAGLSELAKAKSDGGLIAHANDIAHAAMSKLSDKGILTEPREGSLDDQAAMFKGAFVRGLASLNANERRQEVTDFLRKNAESMWRQEKGDGGVITDRWQGGSRNTNVGSHASGVDILVAAAGTE